MTPTPNLSVQNFPDADSDFRTSEKYLIAFVLLLFCSHLVQNFVKHGV